MSIRSFIAVGLWLGACAVAGEAAAENRIALVMGNSAYQSVPALPNPANDAKAMADMLSAAGFDVVTAPDLTQGAMRSTIGDFAEKVAAKGRDTVALVFYAGHGVQVDGENYLVPVDAHIGREADVPLQALRLADLMNALAAVPAKTRIVMLDACRNNPFSEINKVTGRGLAIVDAPTGSIVSYSTAPGSEAEDGTGADSPYTTALLTVAREPGVPIEQAFKRVRYSVHQATNGRQTPWESSSLTGDFSFFPGEAKVTPPQPPAATPASAAVTGSPATGPVSASLALGGAGTDIHAAPRVSSRSSDSWAKELRTHSAHEAYEIVIGADTVEAYQAYLALYGAQSDAPRVRDLVTRRKIMIAWYTAVTINTPASFATFLASYPDSDLTVTAQRLLERARNRSLIALLPPIPVVAAPTCPCTQPAPAKRDKDKAEKRDKADKRTDRKSGRHRRHVDDDDEDTGPPQRVAVPVGPVGPVGVVGPVGPGIIGPGGRGIRPIPIVRGGGPGPIVRGGGPGGFRGPVGPGLRGPVGPFGPRAGMIGRRPFAR